MTLRDIASWSSETYAVFARDLHFVSTASLLDWPLYMIVLASPVAFLALAVFFGVVVGIPAGIWLEFVQKNFDHEGKPLTRIGTVLDRIYGFVILICVCFLIWIVVGIVVFLVAINLEGPQGLSKTAVWAAFALPTLASFGFLYFAIRGRTVMARDGSNSTKTKSK